jgi:hypothetical protein
MNRDAHGATLAESGFTGYPSLTQSALPHWSSWQAPASSAEGDVSDAQPYHRRTAPLVGRGVCPAPGTPRAISPGRGGPACRYRGRDLRRARPVTVGRRVINRAAEHQHHHADVQKAIWADHVKTFGPRGTVHVLPTRDLSIWTGALSALSPGPSPFAQDVRLTSEQTDVLVTTIAEVLEGAELTAEELTEALLTV